MSKTLYLFVTSERPDQYLNPVAHNLLYEQIGAIVFINIMGHPSVAAAGNLPNGKGNSAKVSRNVQILLESLTKGVYRYFGAENDPVESKSIYTPERLVIIKELYKQCLDKDVNWHHHDVEYFDLRKGLVAIKKQKEYVLDITAIGKPFLGDILSLLESLRESTIFILLT